MGYLAIRFFILREVEKVEMFIAEWSRRPQEKTQSKMRYLFKRTHHIDESFRALLNQREVECLRFIICR